MCVSSQLFLSQIPIEDKNRDSIRAGELMERRMMRILVVLFDWFFMRKWIQHKSRLSDELFVIFTAGHRGCIDSGLFSNDRKVRQTDGTMARCEGLMMMIMTLQVDSIVTGGGWALQTATNKTRKWQQQPDQRRQLTNVSDCTGQVRTAKSSWPQFSCPAIHL